MKIFPQGGARGPSAPNVNLGPPHVSETTRARQLKFYTPLEGPSTPFRFENFLLGACRGRIARSVYLGHPSYL